LEGSLVSASIVFPFDFSSSSLRHIFERAKFNKRKQEDSENVENFVTSLYTLSEHCGYNYLREEMIRDRIAVGIKDANLLVKMQLDPDLTLTHFAKCPMFEHLKHFTPFAGQLSLEWFW
jgi:hypothetical protein